MWIVVLGLLAIYLAVGGFVMFVIAEIQYEDYAYIVIFIWPLSLLSISLHYLFGLFDKGE